MSLGNPAPLDLCLRQIRLEARGIASYEFVSADGRPLPPFTAGAHIDLHLPREMIRSYSLLNAPSDAARSDSCTTGTSASGYITTSGAKLP